MADTKRPTTKDIIAEIAALTEMKPRVRRFSAFGDDNHNAIDAQLQVLEDRMTDDDILDHFVDNALDEAMNARRWLDGDSEDGPPSAGWKELCNG